MGTTLAGIANYIVETRSDAVGGATRDAALRCLYDVIVAAAAGYSDCGPNAVRRSLGLLAYGQVPVWFSDVTSSAIGAAWANSAAASAQDLDDGHRLARGHPGAVVIPTVIAVGHARRMTWDRILTAIVVGYEVGITIAAARRDYGNTGTWGAYAAVAAAGALSDTPVSVLEHALAIAGESAPNQLFASAPMPRNPAPEGSHVKEGIPWSVVTGMAALQLAEAGHTGPRNILDNLRHYDRVDPFGMGRDPHINHAYHKLYACCRHIHAPLDALLGLMADHNLRKADAILVETTSGAMRISNLTDPRNLVDMQYSIPYCLAFAFAKGGKGMVWLGPDMLHDPEALALASGVRLVLEPSFDARFPAETPARVTVSSQGRDFVSPVTLPRGEGADPLSWDDLRQKAAAVAQSLNAPELGRILGDLADGLAADRPADLDGMLGSKLFHMADHP